MVLHTSVPNESQVLCILKELYKSLFYATWYIRKIQSFRDLQTCVSIPTQLLWDLRKFSVSYLISSLAKWKKPCRLRRISMHAQCSVVRTLVCVCVTERREREGRERKEGDEEGGREGGRWPVISHPMCTSWSPLWHLGGARTGLPMWAEVIRKWGCLPTSSAFACQLDEKDSSILGDRWQSHQPERTEWSPRLIMWRKTTYWSGTPTVEN